MDKVALHLCSDLTLLVSKEQYDKFDNLTFMSFATKSKEYKLELAKYQKYLTDTCEHIRLAINNSGSDVLRISVDPKSNRQL